MDQLGLKSGPSPLWTSRTSRSFVVRGEALLKAGACEEARDLAQSVLERDALHVPAMELLARALWQLKEYRALTELVPRMIRQNPYEPGYHALKGSVHFQLGQFPEAMDSYERCLQMPSPSEESVRASVAALREYQQMLALMLLQENQVFRAAYAQDPTAACQSVGLRVGPGGEKTAAGKVVRVVRPS
jgi:tetratricopeptide (TPR) repeat protein